MTSFAIVPHFSVLRGNGKQKGRPSFRLAKFDEIDYCNQNLPEPPCGGSPRSTVQTLGNHRIRRLRCASRNWGGLPAGGSLFCCHLNVAILARLLLLSVLFAAANLWFAAARTTIPLKLRGTVTHKQRLIEKTPGVDDVYIT
ncbi:MAG: hypothetical protein R3C05_10890 [Pirellulaceae bacterium]